MAGVKITTKDLMQPASQVLQGQVMPAPYNPAVSGTTNTLDGFIQILTRIERIVNSPTVQPIFKRALERWETQNGLGTTGGQNMQNQYYNPQVWEAPAQAQPPQQTEAPKQTEASANTQPPQFTEDQLRQYFNTSDDVITFIEKLLEILPDEIQTHEVALFVTSYIGQLPNQKIKHVRPLFKAGKPLLKQQLAPIYAKQESTGGKGAEKGGCRKWKQKE